ncbi:MAG: response regulator transcription factor [Actinomycetota bacterium]|nr:MAG: LuxR family two component transcriptional regulator [Acidimicrobiaceae bacterium]
MTDAVRVLIADDHATYLRALEVMLSGDPSIEVVGSAHDGDEAVRLALELQPDVTLMDVHMPAMTGIEATRQLVEAAPHIAIVVLTMFDDDDVVANALRAGAHGFVLKGARQHDIRRAIHAAHAGDSIISGGIARRLATLVADPAAPATAGPMAPSPFPTLTERERDVLRELAHGASNVTIAQTLFLSEKTVRNYVSMVLVKLGVTSRTAAALAARDAGL